MLLQGDEKKQNMLGDEEKKMLGDGEKNMLGGDEEKVPGDESDEKKMLGDEETCEKMSRFLIAHAQARPKLRAEFHQVEEIGEKVYRIAVAVRNDGYLPTNVTEQAIKMKQAKPVEARIHLGEKDTLLVGDAKQEIGHLSSYGGRRKVEWTVRFAGDPTATVEISSKKAGAVRLEVADGLRL